MTSSPTKTAPTKRELRKAATRAAVLQAAIKVFAEGSVVNTPVEEVTKEAGVSKATLFFHFGSRIELLEEIAKELFRYGVDAIWHPAEAGVVPFIRAYLATQRVPETRLLWEIGDVLTVAGRPGPDVAYAEAIDEVKTRLGDDGVANEMREPLARIVAAALLHVGRRAAFEQADDQEMERLVEDVETLLAPWRR